MVEAVSGSERVTVRGLGLTRSDVLVGLLLVLILLVGGYFRFVGQNWDDFVRFHPDERFLSDVASSLNRGFRVSNDFPQEMLDRCIQRYPDTGGRGGYFDAECSLLNPNNVGHGLYVYGTLPTFLVRWTADIVSQTTGDTVWSEYTAIHLVGRALSAFAELGVILVVFFIGVGLHGRAVGLVAAALYACAVFPIQQAHFWTADAITNLFVALAIWAAIRVQQRGNVLTYLEFGVWCGAALASRINTAPLVGLLLVASVVQLLPALDGRLAWRERNRLFMHNFAGLVVAGFFTLLVFRVFNPYAFMGPGFFGLSLNPRWLQDLGEAQHLVSGNAESPPNWQWVGRTRYLFAFNNMVLWGMGIALGLTGWAAWLWSGWRLVRGQARALANLLPFIWILVYFGWLGNQWVMSMRYYLPLYPVFALLAGWALVELARRADRSGIGWRIFAARALAVVVVGFTALWAVMFTNIYRHLFSPAAASHWIMENVSADFSLPIEGSDTIINIPVVNQFNGDDMALEFQASRYEAGQSFVAAFVAPADGTVNHLHSPHLGQMDTTGGPALVRFTIGSSEGGVGLSEGEINGYLPREAHPLGSAYDIPLSPPLAVKAGQTYSFTVQVIAGGPVISAGAVFNWEGDWDEPVPPKVCDFPEGVTLADDPPPGLKGPRDCGGTDLWSAHINGYKLQVYWEEEEYKRERFLTVLNNSDYLIIGTNRRYDSQSRIPQRWPMTMAYYDALFSGELGFELVQTFHRTFEFGPLRVSDQYLPTYTAPAWLNEFEAEEAFHVYDHPAVFIFRKSDSYSPEKTRDLLYGVPLAKPYDVQQHYACPWLATAPPNPESAAAYYCDPALVGVVPQVSLPASAAPTFLEFTPDMQKMQTEGGTWSDRFDSSSAINTQPALTIIGWWLTIVIFGLAAWPLLFALFPGLVDRGYGFAKLAGMLIVGWGTWYAASARLPVWSRQGILAGLVLLALVSALVGWRRRGELAAYVREHAARLIGIEAITLLAFVFFLAIRLTNPDLWHPSFGGEKPMDFAYFNGVLRSTIFPPVDPWHAGGFINYYYWGYVLVGVPTLLLGVIPSIAYNLIIPTLFALTGIGAFAVAFNVVAAWRERRADALDPDKPYRLGNPWVAGIAALLLAVVLGNLDTPRVFIAEGLTRTGFYQQPSALQDALVLEYMEAHNNESPPPEAMAQIAEQALRESNDITASIARGLRRVLDGELLDLPPNRWYWAPTRILSEPPVSSGGAIAEMPFFTFLYGDLHAHMISMSMMLLVMGFVLNELLLAGNDTRRGWAKWLALALGAGTVGLLRATNTWDWITFMLLSVAGLGFAWWLAWRQVGRRSLVDLALRLGGFVVLSFLLALPYATWYASVYSRAMPWDGPRSPLWTYITIYGLFLFLVLSLLVWDTGRWLRSVYVGSLRGKGTLLALLLAAALAILAGIVILAAGGYPVTIIAAPLLLWIAVLFFRQGQSREMQFILALAGLALSLSLGVEFIVLEGDVGRQNTVFKFYIQAWLLLSVAGGAAFAWLLHSAARWGGWTRSLWFAVGGLLVTMAALYPLMATRGRALDRMAETPLTLDGMEYMKTALLYEGSTDVLQNNPSAAPFPLSGDYNIIRWLQENVQGTPVIMEGRADREYRWESRISIYTGLPSVNGWNFHQRQQRTFDPMPRMVEQRVANINAFYTTPDVDTAMTILRHYHVEYVIVSDFERAYYPASSFTRFDRMVEEGLLEVVYKEGNSVIYRVVGGRQTARATNANG
ncbi:MAG: hypothetical protein HZC41_20720 [Chloroflexi bacterium]|nr:hypothetical protein [Chloroflexota bacterium]